MNNNGIDFNSILADEKLQTLFRSLNINEEKQQELCSTFYEHFSTLPTTESNLTKIKAALTRLGAVSMNSNELQDTVKEITNCLERHVMIFNSTIKRLQTVEVQTNQLITEIQEMKEKSNMNDGLILSNEIATLYFEIFIKPVFSRLLNKGSWDYFTNKLRNIEDELDKKQLLSLARGDVMDNEELYRPLLTFLQPLQEHIPVSLTDIRNLKNDRVDIAHIRQKSNREKLLLIEKGKNFHFSDRFEHQQLVKTMINALDQHMTSSRRST